MTMDSKTHVAEEISAYLDGEVDAAARARIEGHLRACRHCGQRYHELRMVTTQVRSLRAPEVRPEFVTRVMARVREEEAPPQTWWQRLLAALTPAGPALATAAFGLAAFGLVAAGLYNVSRTPESPATPNYAAMAPSVGFQASNDSSANVIDELVDAGIDTETLAEYAESDVPELLDTDAQSASDANELIDNEFLAMLDAGFSGTGDDVYESISDLTAEEQAELQLLLQGGYYDTTTDEEYFQ